MQINVVEVVGSLVKELTPLSSEERQRVLQAALALLGERPAVAQSGGRQDRMPADPSAEDGNFPPRARAWMRQNQIPSNQIENLYHKSDDGLELIAAEMPGKTNREKIRNAYTLLGVARFLETGEGRFDDKPARNLCERYGFFDGTNHMKYMKCSEFTGSREKGWTLTAPGLKLGASLVKELVAATE